MSVLLSIRGTPNWRLFIREITTPMRWRPFPSGWKSARTVAHIIIVAITHGFVTRSRMNLLPAAEMAVKSVT